MGAKMMLRAAIAGCMVLVWCGLAVAAQAATGGRLESASGEQGKAMSGFREPLRRVVDLNIGETAEVKLANGESVRAELLEVRETADKLRHAVREARVKARIGDQEVWLSCATYHLPTMVAGVQVDCPITKGYYRNTGEDAWGLEKDARLRLWPAGWPWIEPDSYLYPAKQRWFATNTQMANEPAFVDITPDVSRERIYYHDQLDIGGAEGLVEVVSATDGVVIVRGEQARDDIAEFGYQPRYDRVAILDERGWLHVYSHLKSIDGGIAVGKRVGKGDRIGRLGKEGSSGGWAHLHYGIRAKQPSGKWGTEEGYAYLWQAYLREHDPWVVAVARPHHLLMTGEEATLDGSRSWAKEGPLKYEWTFTDGSTARGPKVERTYRKAGVYSEILKVTDSRGNVGYDFAVVQVYDAEKGKMPPGIHAAYAPTLGIKPGDPVTFAVRTFNTTQPGEVWDFGDGTAPVAVKCVPVKPDGSDALAADGYALTVHRYSRPGDYLARVEHVEQEGTRAVARLQVRVAAE
jgi:hypothetical protein